MEDDISFENFKSDECHVLKEMGDIRYLKNLFESNEIDYYFKSNQFLKCYYLLGMADYLCRKNNLPFSNNYNHIRQYKFDKLIFPRDVILSCILFNNDDSKKEILKMAIPEFLKYNIVENGVYDAC